VPNKADCEQQNELPTLRQTILEGGRTLGKSTSGPGGDGTASLIPSLLLCLGLCGLYTHAYKRTVPVLRVESKEFALLRFLMEHVHRRTLCATPSFANPSYGLLKTVLASELRDGGDVGRDTSDPGPIDDPLFSSLRPTFLRDGSPAARHVAEFLQQIQKVRTEALMAEQHKKQRRQGGGTVVVAQPAVPSRRSYGFHGDTSLLQLASPNEWNRNVRQRHEEGEDETPRNPSTPRQQEDSYGDENDEPRYEPDEAQPYARYSPH
jgi:hypothetical protein